MGGRGRRGDGRHVLYWFLGGNVPEKVFLEMEGIDSNRTESRRLKDTCKHWGDHLAAATFAHGRKKRRERNESTS